MRARTAAVATIAAAAAAAGLVAWLRPAPVPVETALVVRGPIREVVEGTGRSRVRDRYLVAAPVSGHLGRLTVVEGERVVAGQPLAAIAPAASGPLDARTRAELAARLEAARAGEAEARAAVARAEVAAEVAAAEHRRVEALAAGGSVAQRDLELAGFTLRERTEEQRMAAHAVRRAAGEVAAARAMLAGAEAAGRGERVVLRAPVAGLVLRLHRESEGPVAAGAPIVEVGDPAALEVELDLLTTQAVRVRSGAAVALVGWGGAGALAGRVRRVDPSAFTKVSALGVEEQRVHVVVDPVPGPEAWNAPAAGAGGLGDGYAVEAEVVVAERAEALKAPAGALFRSGERWATFVVEGGRARLRRLEVAERNAAEVAVAEGLQAGDRVVLHPTDKVSDGARVAPR
jgi:HlyD family secretion protein